MLSHICTDRGMLKLPTMIICLSFKFFDNFIHIWNYENLIFLFNWFIIMKCFFVSLIIFLALNSDLFNSATAMPAFFLLDSLVRVYHGLPWWLKWWRICLQWRRPGLSPWVEKFPGEGNSNPLQYSYLENPMDTEVWQAIVHRVAKS